MRQVSKEIIISGYVRWFLAFMAFSCVGWAYEILYDWFVNGLGFVMRASLLGPWCPIYGIGGVLIVAVFSNFIKRKHIVLGHDVTPILAVFGIIALVIGVELVGSYICEATMGYFPWDYSGDFMNFEGRIALRFTTIFTVGGMFFLYWLWPRIVSFCEQRISLAKLVTGLLSFLFVCDMIGENLGIWQMVR